MRRMITVGTILLMLVLILAAGIAAAEPAGSPELVWDMTPENTKTYYLGAELATITEYGNLYSTPGLAGFGVLNLPTGVTPVWDVQKISGTATYTTRTYSTSIGLTLSSLPAAEEDMVLRVSCTIGSETLTGDYTIRFVNAPSLPEGIEMDFGTEMTVKSGDVIDLNSHVRFTDGWTIEGAFVSANLGGDSNLFNGGMTNETVNGVWSYVAQTPGYYDANVTMQCGNLLICKPFTLKITDENGNVPAAGPKLYADYPWMNGEAATVDYTIYTGIPFSRSNAVWSNAEVIRCYITNMDQMQNMYGGSPVWSFSAESGGEDCTGLFSVNMSDSMIYGSLKAVPTEPMEATLHITCTWGNGSTEKTIRLHAVTPDFELPEGVDNLPETIETQVGETITLSPTILPADWSLNGIEPMYFCASQLYSFADRDWMYDDEMSGRYTITDEGIYNETIGLRYGTLMVTKTVIFRVADENGQMNVCEHEHTEPYSGVYTSGSNYTCTDAQTHHVTGTGYSYDYCEDCGEQLNHRTYPVDREEPHYYGGGSKCVYCGYECKHEGAERPEPVIDYEWVNAENHNRIERTPGYYLECDICGKREYIQENVTTTTEAHADADGNGVCDLCGNSMAGNWSWRINSGKLVIEGTGAIPDFGSAAETAWYGRRGEINEVILSEGITGIGQYAFAGLENTTRITFRQEERPEIDELAFSGSNIICRYFTEPEAGEENTWTGTYGATGIRWIYLPKDNTTSQFEYLYYYENDGYWGTGWYVYNNDYVKVSREQADELGLNGRRVILNALPSSQADRDLYEQHWETMVELSLAFPGEGTYNLTIPGTVHNMVLKAEAPGWTLNIDASAAANDAFAMLWAAGGTLDFTAPNISTMFLCGYYYDNETPTGNITIHGNIETLNYYNMTNSDRRFAGTMTVLGTIRNGYEYGTATAVIPNIPNVTAPNMIVSKFSNVNQTQPIVLNSALNVAGTENYGTYTPENCSLGYQLTNNNGEDWWRLQISPLTGDNAQPVHIEIQDYNPDFTIDDVYWGEHTNFTFNRARPGQTVELTIPEGAKANYVCVMESNAVINGEIHQLDVQDWTKDNPFQVTVNGPVEYFNGYLEFKTCSMTLGRNGLIEHGQLRRPLHDVQYFENAGAGQIMANSRLTILSHLSGQRISSIPTDEETLTTAAGLQNSGTAVMKVTDASLSAEEKLILSGVTDTYGGTADTVFDVSVLKYNSEGEFIANATELNAEVPVTVKNMTGTTAYVARIHDGTAEKLTNETDTDTILFNSNLFSKYVLVRTGGKTFAKPDISVEYYLGDNSVLISFPWVDGADYHEISIYKPDGTPAYSWSNVYWGPERSMAPACMFQVNIVQGGQDRLMAAGDYYAIITLKGEGYEDTTFRQDFRVFSSLPNFPMNKMPEGLTKIEEEALAGVKIVRTAIPDRCTEIGKKAFYGSALSEILIPDSVATIGEEAFPAETVIYTTKGSKAQEWAEENGYTVYLVIR